jgi:hypothetical protein
MINARQLWPTWVQTCYKRLKYELMKSGKKINIWVTIGVVMCEPCGEKNFIKVHEPQKYQMI